MMPNQSFATASDSDTSWVQVDEHGPAYQHQESSDQSEAGDSMASETQRQEAYYLFFVGAVGIALNVLVVLTIILRRTLRKMTSAFLIHACFLNLLKSAYCIPFGVNLLNNLPPSDCSFEGSSYVVIVTTSAFNMVAMICAEAYTFGENNVGGKSRGSCCCVLFGVLMVYICSLVLHLGPTLIGGYFEYNPDIGNCSFARGKVTGYIANVMWISIVTLCLVAVAHFLCKMYKEIQKNQPNRVSMLVRTSITIMEDADSKQKNCSLRVMVKEASHRAKIFVITVMAYVLSWFPLFLLVIIDINFRVSPKVYQAFSFIAWTQGSVEPLIYICFDRQLNLLARWVYCDRYKKYDSNTLAYLMATNRGAVAGETECVMTSCNAIGGAGGGGGATGGRPTSVSTAVASSAHNSIGGCGAAAYPYHDDLDDEEEDEVSEVSTGHPSPPSDPRHNAAAAAALPAPAAGLSGLGVGGVGGLGGLAGGSLRGGMEPLYGNQRSLGKGPGSLKGSQHEVTASMELRVPNEVHC